MTDFTIVTRTLYLPHAQGYFSQFYNWNEPGRLYVFGNPKKVGGKVPREFEGIFRALELEGWDVIKEDVKGKNINEDSYICFRDLSYSGFKHVFLFDDDYLMRESSIRKSLDYARENRLDYFSFVEDVITELGVYRIPNQPHIKLPLPALHCSYVGRADWLKQDDFWLKMSKEKETADWSCFADFVLSKLLSDMKELVFISVGDIYHLHHYVDRQYDGKGIRDRIDEVEAKYLGLVKWRIVNLEDDEL